LDADPPAQGVKIARRLTLYGYTPRKGEAGGLDINPETAGVVKRIYEEYVSGASPRAIAAGLNADNIPAPRGGKWNASTINGNTARGQGLLLNEKFVGRVVGTREGRSKTRKLDAASLAQTLRVNGLSSMCRNFVFLTTGYSTRRTRGV
jgi:hypothetical protein